MEEISRKMYKGDSHIHSCFSTDSNEKLENIIERAIELGLDEIVVTDSYGLCRQGRGRLFCFQHR